MAKLTAMPSLAIISGFKGTLDFYYWMGIPCCRRWPQSPGKSRSAAVQAQWPTFTEASRLWTETSSDVKHAYNAMAVGTNFTGRDLFTRGYIAGATRMYG